MGNGRFPAWGRDWVWALACAQMVGCGAAGASSDESEGDGQLTDGPSLGSSSSQGGGSEGSSGAAETDTGGGIGDDVWVPLDVSQREFAVECIGTPDGRVASVAPGGELWIAREGVGTTTLEVHALDGGVTEYEIAGELGELVAWTGDRASAIVDGALVQIDRERLTTIRWSEALGEPTGLCGDPARDGDGLVLAADVFSRDLGQWWQWHLPGDELGHGAVFARSAGACSGPASRAWIRQGETVWSLEPDWFGHHPGLEPSTALAADDAFGVASIIDGHLSIAGDMVLEVGFEAGTAASLAAAPGRLWVTAGGHTYVFESASFYEVVGPQGPLSSDALWADAVGGVWFERDGTLCRAAPGPALQLFGVRPYERIHTGELDVSIPAAAGVSNPRVHLDGDEIEIDATDAGWTVSLAALAEGWHDVSVEADGPTGPLRRDLAFEVVGLRPAVWAGEIELLVQEHCGSDACHGPGSPMTQPDLTDYENWEALAATVRDRVVVKGDMPPIAARKPNWGVDDVLRLAGWIEAGTPEEEP